MLTDNVPHPHTRRVTMLAFCFTFGFSVIVGQLLRYQVLDHRSLSQEALAQRTREKVLAAPRGSIADANGHLLALDVVYWDISVSPLLVPKARKEDLANRLAALLGIPKDQIDAKLASKEAWLPIATHVNQEIGEAIADLQVNGIICEPKPLRVYPEGGLFAHLIGIVNDAGDGFYGIEGYYDLELKGINGTKRVEQDTAGKELPFPPLSINPPKPGTNLVLTVDRNIQYIAQEELGRALEEFGAESGTVVIMDPQTGAILASVSLPTYDPNDFSKAELSLLADPVVSSMWEPGSILKVVTWSAGLDSGTISPGTTFNDDGALEVGGRVIQNWDRQGHGLVTMQDGLVESLNTVAAFISTSMGKDRFYTYLRRFGFGQLTDVDLASEGPGMMKLPGDSNWFPSELGTNAFGQGIATTPIQVITAFSAVANRGMMMKPYVVRQFITVDSSGAERVIQVEPMTVRRAISEEAAQTMTEMLVTAVEREGYAKARVPGYRIAGKTGTAQIPTAYGYHPTDTIASFVGFAPADDPQFAVLVKLDRPQKSPWGTQTAAPTFQAIAQRLFTYLQIPPDEIRLANPQ